MKSQVKYLTGELALIDELISKLSNVTTLDKGCFLAERRRKNTYYYFRKHGERSKIYLGTAKSHKVKRHKQNEMANALLDELKKDRNSISNCISAISNRSPKEIMNSIPSKYAEIDAELFLFPRIKELYEWANTDYEKNPATYPDSNNIALDGTRMRSKGESLWYNLLTESNIPFRTDCLLTFTDKNGLKVKRAPDFLIQCYDGTFIIIEHLGMLDNDYYLRGFIEKIQIYQASGYVIGSNFFITSDDINSGTDSQAIERIIGLIKQRFLDGAPAEVKLLL